MPITKWFPPVDPPDQPPPSLKGSQHPSRLSLERLLADNDDLQAWEDLRETYEEMAPEWHDWSRSQPGYAAAVREGLRHATPVDWIVEVGCGTGEATEVLAESGAMVVATDVNEAMLTRSRELARTHYLLADVHQLPFADGSVPLLVGLNAVPDLEEFRRVVAGDGQILWCSSFRNFTPLYVAPQRFVDLLGSQWTAVAGKAGHGDWVLAGRG